MTQKVLLASTSTVYGKPYLSYLFDAMISHFRGIREVTFIPYARPGGIDYDTYTAKAREAFAQIGLKIKGIHEYANPNEGISEAEAFFVGGGNTFVLLNTLYYNRVLDGLTKAIKSGKPYMGASAGTNIAGRTIMNTNDMPIILPPTFKSMGLIPFNINPHFLDPQPDSQHMGETRETRIREFHVFNSIPVMGLREGSWLEIDQQKVTLKGNYTARWFSKGKEPIELASENTYSFEQFKSF